MEELQVQHETKELVDSMGFDNALRDIALYAEKCANIKGQNISCKRAFYKVFAEVSKLADIVEDILRSNDPIETGLRQFQE